MKIIFTSAATKNSSFIHFSGKSDTSWIFKKKYVYLPSVVFILMYVVLCAFVSIKMYSLRPLSHNLNVVYISGILGGAFYLGMGVFKGCLSWMQKQKIIWKEGQTLYTGYIFTCIHITEAWIDIFFKNSTETCGYISVEMWI